MAAEIKADEWADEIAPSLTERAEIEPPYKVDALCEDYIDSFLHQHMRDRVAKTAYEHGVERADVLAVLHVVLRNRLLADTGRDPHTGKAKTGEPATDTTTTAAANTP